MIPEVADQHEEMVDDDEETSPTFDWSMRGCNIILGFIFKFLWNAICFIPAYFVVGIASVDWYNLCYVWAEPHLEEPFSISSIGYWVVVIVFNIIEFLCLWSYYKTIFTSSAVKDNPPNEFDYQISQNGRNVIVQVPRCNKCDSLRPPRTHHCSLCGTCTLKMDHHCPWVMNCVGWTNYKYFLLFIFYATVGCLLYSSVGLARILSEKKDSSNKKKDYDALSLLAGVLSGTFGVTLVFFLGFHLKMVSKNFTTLEMGDNEESVWNLGTLGNFQEVFGKSTFLWFFPINTLSQSGHHFQTSKESVGLVRRGGGSNGSGEEEFSPSNSFDSDHQPNMSYVSFPFPSSLRNNSAESQGIIDFSSSEMSASAIQAHMIESKPIYDENLKHEDLKDQDSKVNFHHNTRKLTKNDDGDVPSRDGDLSSRNVTVTSTEQVNSYSTFSNIELQDNIDNNNSSNNHNNNGKAQKRR